MVPSETYAYEGYFQIIILALISGAALILFMVVATGHAPAETSSYVVVENVSQPEVYTHVPTPMPEPEPTLSQEQFMSMYGGVPQGQWVSMQRLNVSGYKDLGLHTRVWDWITYPKVTWWSYSWGKYFMQGAGEGKKFLFVFIDTYTDEGSARMWGLGCDNYYLQYNDTITQFSDDILLPAIRLKEFDNYYDGKFRDGTHAGGAIHYGYIRTQDDLNRDSAIPIGFIKAGESNMWTGYCVTTVPWDFKPEYAKIHGNFGHLMPGKWWQLT